MASGISRVTVVAPRIRFDLALPSDVPLADLLPTVLRYAGTDLADDVSARSGWSLSRLGGLVLDSSHTPAQLEVRDGELLYLRPRGDEGPKPVFDDVVDAVATSTLDRAGRWNPAATRQFGLGLGVLSLLGGAVALLLAGPPQLLEGLIALGLVVVLLGVVTVFARALSDSRSATALALVALVYAAVGGLLVLAGDRSVGHLAGPHVLIAATAVMTTTAVAGVAVGDSVPVFLCAGLCAGAVLLTAVIGVGFGVSSAAAAAATVTLSLAMLPALPTYAYRLAKLPVPTVPTEREHLRQDTEQVDGAMVLGRSGLAEGFLGGMISALAIIAAGGAVLVSADGDRGLALCVALGLLLMARARWFVSRRLRLPLLGAGVTALAAAVVAAFVAARRVERLTTILGVVIGVAAISIGFALAGGRRQVSPLWGRLLDVLEVLLILTVVPLAVWVTGLYAWIRTIRG